MTPAKGKAGRTKKPQAVPLPRSTPDGSGDAAAARAGLEEELLKGRRARPVESPIAAGPEPLSDAEIQGAGLMLQDLFKMIATVRGPHWNVVPDELVPRAGRPAALILRKYGPYAERYPEVALALVLMPPVFAALKVEYDLARAKVIAARRAQSRDGGLATPAGIERGRTGAEGGGENLAGTVVIGTPLPMPDRGSAPGV